MEANRRQGGIKLLLAAEQEAQQIVNAARSGISSLIDARYWSFSKLVAHVRYMKLDKAYSSEEGFPCRLTLYDSRIKNKKLAFSLVPQKYV